MTREYVAELVAAHPGIREVWLFGSRANGRAGPKSDWDYLVFGEHSLLNTLHLATQFDRPGIDLLFEGAPGIAAQPWPRDFQKILCLGHEPGGLRWRKIADTLAEYSEPVNRDLGASPSMVTEFRTAKAVLVYRRAS